MAAGAKQILVVDDNPDDVVLLGRLVRDFPVELISMPTGVAALEYLFDPQQALPEVVLLDLILPQMHGFDVLREIRHHERTKRLPVVIVTSSADEKGALKYYRVGIDGFLVKPVQLSELMEVLSLLSLTPTPGHQSPEARSP